MDTDNPFDVYSLKQLVLLREQLDLIIVDKLKEAETALMTKRVPELLSYSNVERELKEQLMMQIKFVEFVKEEYTDAVDFMSMFWYDGTRTYKMYNAFFQRWSKDGKPSFTDDDYNEFIAWYERVDYTDYEYLCDELPFIKYSHRNPDNESNEDKEYEKEFNERIERGDYTHLCVYRE